MANNTLRATQPTETKPNRNMSFGDLMALIASLITLLGIILAIVSGVSYQTDGWFLVPLSAILSVAIIIASLRASERVYQWQPYAILFMGFITFGWVAGWFIARCTVEVAVSPHIALTGAGALLMVFQAAFTRPQSGDEVLTKTVTGWRRLTLSERFSRWRDAQSSENLSKSTLLYATIIFAAIVAMIPFLWMISNSLMTLGEALTRSTLPADAIGGLCNYVEAWDEANFSKFFLNSIIITFVTIFGLLTTSILSAYAFARINFVGRNTIFTLLLITLMIPESVTLVPNYLIITGFIPIIPSGIPESPFITFAASWLNTLTALTLPFMASAFSIFLLRQFFITIPNELWEACRIDGGGHLRFLVQIVLPISRAPILTVTLLTFIGTWNAFLWPLIVTTNETWRPLMVGLYNFTTEAGTQIHLLMAGSFITILPMLLLYFMTQKAFTEGIATSGLKG